jgi:ATP-binding protein involved in chromosome partitioning
MPVTKEAVIESLKTVRGPDFEGDIVSLGMVSDIFIADAKVFFSITVPAARAKELEPLRAAAERVVKAMPGVAGAIVALTAEKRGGGMEAPIPPRPVPPPAHPAAPAAPMVAPPAPASRSQGKRGVPGIEAIIAVASGKGGVGKSTTAVNLALALRSQGLAIGILDADIYGPSLPKLLNIKGRPSVVAGRTLSPLEAYGCKAMSIGLVVDADKALVWRGPMVASALTQMLRDIAWGALDVLIVDMPPGTGDVQLTLAQSAPLAGAIIVSTPQDLALIDARRGVEMFRSVSVPVLGVVENMSFFLCPHCGERTDIFGHGGARKEAERLKVPFLGEVPLDMAIRETSDSGLPVVATQPEGPHAKIYREIAGKVREQLQGGAVRAAPKIVIEA